jgi:ketosteroid isomerase-like protein
VKDQLATAKSVEQISDANRDQTEIHDKLEKWRDLFSPGEREFSFANYKNLYINSDELLVYDSYAPVGYNREIRGWDNYKTLWEKFIPIDFPEWRIINLDITHIEIQGDTAWSAVSFVGRGVKDGKDYIGGQHGTHVWKRIDGEWRTIHEHLTTMADQEIQSRISQST